MYSACGILAFKLNDDFDRILKFTVDQANSALNDLSDMAPGLMKVLNLTFLYIKKTNCMWIMGKLQLFKTNVTDWMLICSEVCV